MKWLFASIPMLFCLLLLAGLSGADEGSNGNMTDDNVTEAYTYIFLQEGTGGSFVKDENGNYTLTITGVIPYTAAFSDRPARDASFVKMAEFLSGFNFDPNNPPNAALMIRAANETEDAIVVELSAPQYDEVNATLTYSAKVTYDLEFESGWAQDFAQKGDAAIPESFGAVILVIDDCPCMDYRSCPSGWHDSCWKFPFCNPTCGGCC